MAGEGYLAKILIKMKCQLHAKFDFQDFLPLLTYKATEIIKLSLVVYVS